MKEDSAYKESASAAPILEDAPDLPGFSAIPIVEAAALPMSEYS